MGNIVELEERFSITLATKEDIYRIEKELNNFKLEVEQRFSKVEKELITLKLLLWIVIILTGLSSFPQILNLLKLMK